MSDDNKKQLEKELSERQCTDMSEEDLFLDPDSIFNRNKRAPAAICGQNPILPTSRIGCGQIIETCVEVYRCADCDTPFHKECIKKHFGTHAQSSEQP